MESKALREASPFEKRCIVRENLGYYSTIAVGGIYSIPCKSAAESQLGHLELYAPALAECIKEHRFLSVTIEDALGNRPTYVGKSQLNLQHHFRSMDILDLSNQITKDHEPTLIQAALKRLHNDPTKQLTNIDVKPAWALDVLVLSDQNDPKHYRVFISFTYSHSHGDGMSGLIFHRTFHKALQKSLWSKPQRQEVVAISSTAPFPDQLDTPTKMPISWSYFLPPAVGTFMPSFLTRPLGLSSNISGADERTWTGSKTFTDEKTPGSKVTTSLEIITIDAQTLDCVLTVCRRNAAKLTPLLNFLVARGMSSALKETGRTKEGGLHFVCQTPLNLRRAVDESETTLGNFGGGSYFKYEYQPDSVFFDEDSWDKIRLDGRKLAQVASDAKDQPIGLLRYVSNFAAWMQAQIGQARDVSWELSNLGSFSPEGNDQGGSEVVAVKFEEVMFSQSASCVGPPLTFNVAAIKGGDLKLCITWQVGSLGQLFEGGHEEQEQWDRRFVKHIGSSVKENLEDIGRMC